MVAEDVGDESRFSIASERLPPMQWRWYDIAARPRGAGRHMESSLHQGERTPMATANVTPDRIMQLGLGFWGSKTLLSAVELGLLTELSKGPLDGEKFRQRIGLPERSARDFF